LGCGDCQGHRHQRRCDWSGDFKRAVELSNASFENSDFLDVSSERYGVIAAIEDLNYLSASEQEAFLRKLLASILARF
jgi:hypothetical protein